MKGEISAVLFKGRARDVGMWLEWLNLVYGKDCPLWFIIAERRAYENGKRQI